MAIFSVLALLLLTVCGANAETTQLITFATTTAGATTTGATAAPGGGVTTPGGAVVTTPKVVVSTYAPVTTGNTDIPSSYTTGVNLITTKKTNPVTTAAVQTTTKPKYTTTGDQLGEVTQPTTTTVDDQLGEVTTKKTTTFDDQLPPVVSTTTTPFDDQLGDVSTPPPSFLDFLTLYYNPFAGHCDAYKNSYIQFYACAEAWEDADHLFCRCPCANELAQDSRDNVTAIPCVETCVNGLLSNLGLTSDSLTGSKITVAVSDTCAQMRKRIKFFGSSSSEVGTSGDNGISVATIGVIAACVVLVAVVAGTIIYKRSTRTGSAQIGDENSPAPKQMNRKISRVSVRPLLEV